MQESLFDCRKHIDSCYIAKHSMPPLQTDEPPSLDAEITQAVQPANSSEAALRQLESKPARWQAWLQPSRRRNATYVCKEILRTPILDNPGWLEVVAEENAMHLETLENLESNVRGYVRLFPAVFETASGSELWDSNGRRYIDFFCGAGSLNYGHNNPAVQAALVEYLQSSGIQQSLDMGTRAKIEFIEAFQSRILEPRGYDYKLQFTGPTGTNAVEAALKLARKVTQRPSVIAFTRGYHGHTLGALSATANKYFHDPHFGTPGNVIRFPFDGYHQGLDSAQMLRQMLEDGSSGVAIPAAIILETVQGEGGVNVASNSWLQDIRAVCDDFDILLIVDDIQVGNGRTGTFFSFEEAGIEPDIVCLSKSIGAGLPLSINLLKPQLDIWNPGEHTGTFRGNNLAFVAGRVALDNWQDPEFAIHIDVLRQNLLARLARLTHENQDFDLEVRGRGLIHGLDMGDKERTRKIIEHCFARGLIIESCGPEDEVLKLMPALTTPTSVLVEGMEILDQAVNAVLAWERSGKQLADMPPYDAECPAGPEGQSSAPQQLTPPIDIQLSASNPSPV